MEHVRDLFLSIVCPNKQAGRPLKLGNLPLELFVTLQFAGTGINFITQLAKSANSPIPRGFSRC